ncbi:hypothetical protein H6CHR_02255 [Variovorax sp. PBL-H6]|uniref:hypothetical protein n=1 Tax=Variovorax sp. PBL-H6 TaxID=434009 RepID=UPI001317B35B|nr:hypothetical protein [Variovorax sp. PBL-H6]VTU24747.1 hypothetical protein H6CHR_02255 [Variovorax sp. PBL-H6]
MISLAMKVALLFKALAVLLLLGCSVIAVTQWICPFILPWEFVWYYCVGAIGVAMMVVLGALLSVLKVTLS